MKKLIALFAVAFLFVSSAAFAADTQPELVIKFASAGAAALENSMNEAEMYFKKIVEERSEGKISIELYMGASLGTANTILEGIQLGTIEMGDIETGVTPAFVPSSVVWMMPFLFNNYEHTYAVMDSELGAQLRQDFIDQIGVRNLAYNSGGFRYFCSNKRPVNTKENIQGLKLRVMPNPIMIDSVRAFGASVVTTSFGELYTALQQGVADGQDQSLDLIVSQNYFEVQKYLVMSGHFFQPRQYLINEEFYQSLKPEWQKLITDCAIEACNVQRKLTEEYDQKSLVTLKEKGMVITDDFDYAYFKPLGEALWPQYYEQIGGGDAKLGEERLKKIVEIGEKYKR